MKTSNKTKRSMKRIKKKINKTTLYYLNSKTGNMVGYVRAMQLHIVDKAKTAVKNPYSGRFVSIQRARVLELI